MRKWTKKSKLQNSEVAGQRIPIRAACLVKKEENEKEGKSESEGLTESWEIFKVSSQLNERQVNIHSATP